MRKVLPALAVLIGVGSLLGCGPRIQPQVRQDGAIQRRAVRGSAAAAIARASREIPCAESALVLEDLGSGGYRIEGCGVRMVYTCIGHVCGPDSREALPDSGPPQGVAAVEPTQSATPRASAAEWSDHDVQLLLARIHDDVLACVPAERDSQRLTVELMRSGRLNRLRAYLPLSPASGSCVDERLARERLGRQVSRPRTVVLEFWRGAAPPVSPLVAAENPPPSTPPRVIPTPSPEAAARAAINGRSPAILACVEADALSMQVSWSSEGALDALLRGERQGTPEEACVRAIVQELSIPRPGAPGALIHALQR